MSDRNKMLRKIAIAQSIEYMCAILEAPHSLRGQQLRGSGPVADFESALARRSGFPYCLAVCNATMALFVTALVLEVAGRDVIVPPRSWGGTYGPFSFAGARLIWAGENACGNIDPACISGLVTTQTTAVVATDWKGARHEAQALRKMCDAQGLLYIEDSSFLPLRDNNGKSASPADVQIMSFGPGKPLSLGEGGALLTRHRWIYERAIALSQHPSRTASEEIEDFGQFPFLNARIHPLAATLGTALLAAD
jgi:dTDP-4-amino-4,6-dideoxygalactose transaminase